MCPDLNTGKEISNFIRHLGQVTASTNERRFDVNMNETVTQQHTISNIYSLIFSYLQRRKISCNLRYKVIMQLIFFFAVLCLFFCIIKNLSDQISNQIICQKNHVKNLHNALVNKKQGVNAIVMHDAFN